MSLILRRRLRLYLLRGLAPFLAPSTPSLPLPAVPRLLLIRPDHLGDLLFCTPALRQLRQAQPQAHLTALVGPWGQPVLARNPHLDQVLTLDFPGFNRRPKPSPWQPYTCCAAPPGGCGVVSTPPVCCALTTGGVRCWPPWRGFRAGLATPYRRWPPFSPTPAPTSPAGTK